MCVLVCMCVCVCVWPPTALPLLIHCTRGASQRFIPCCHSPTRSHTHRKSTCVIAITRGHGGLVLLNCRKGWADFRPSDIESVLEAGGMQPGTYRETVYGFDMVVGPGPRLVRAGRWGMDGG